MDRSTDVAKKVAVYRKAADYVYRSYYQHNHTVASCWAVDVAASSRGTMRAITSISGGRLVKAYTRHRTALCDVFAPDGFERDGWWGNELGATREERVNGRILMLCFMAAMVEAGDA
jgi:hypothetical protein